MRQVISIMVLAITLVACGGSSGGSDSDDARLGPIAITGITLEGSSDEAATIAAYLIVDGERRQIDNETILAQGWSISLHKQDLAQLDGVYGADLEIHAQDDLGNERTYESTIHIQDDGADD